MSAGNGKSSNTGSPGQSGSFGAAPASMANMAIGGYQGPNFFSGIANNAPGGAYTPPNQVAQTQQSQMQSQQAGPDQGGLSPEQNQMAQTYRDFMGGSNDLYNQDTAGWNQVNNIAAQNMTGGNSVYGPRHSVYGPSHPVYGQPNHLVGSALQAAEAGLAPEQQQLMDAQTGFFQDSIAPAYRAMMTGGMPSASANTVENAIANQRMASAETLNRMGTQGIGGDSAVPLEQRSFADQINQYPQPELRVDGGPYEQPGPGVVNSEELQLVLPGGINGMRPTPVGRPLTPAKLPALAPRAAPKQSPFKSVAKPVTVKPPVKPAPKPAVKPVTTRPTVQPVLRTAPRPPSR